MLGTTPRLLFCISSGRSGTNYLADLLGAAEEVLAFHEAEPTMTGKFLRMINEAPYADSVNERRIKVEAIRKIIDEMPEGKSVYCETNHMFIKTFFDVVVENFDNVEVIVLRRDLSLVLASFLQMCYFSEVNDVWPDWFSSPNAVTAAVKPIGPDAALDRCDRSIAYLMDIEARALRFQRDYPEVTIHNVRVEELNDYDNVLRFFQDLRITPSPATKEIVGTVTNVRPNRKKRFNSPVDLEYCVERLSKYIEKAWSMGIQLPSSVALDHAVGWRRKASDQREKVIEKQRKTISEQCENIDKLQSKIGDQQTQISELQGELSGMKTIVGSSRWLIGHILRKLHLRK